MFPFLPPFSFMADKLDVSMFTESRNKRARESSFSMLLTFFVNLLLSYDTALSRHS